MVPAHDFRNGEVGGPTCPTKFNKCSWRNLNRQIRRPQEKSIAEGTFYRAVSQ